MKNVYYILSYLIIPFFLFPLAADKIDVSGDWELTVKTPRREITWQVAFVQEGEKLTVTMIGPQGRKFTGEGTVKDEDIEWTITHTTSRGEITRTYKGKVSADEMTGEVNAGRMGSASWKAIRKEE
jgi:hypothetical protein